MLKRIFIYLASVLLVALLVIGYSWLEMRKERAKARKSAEAMIAELTAQKEAIDSLGDVDLNTADLNLAILEEKLHQPALRQSGAHSTTMLGWACADTSCAISASFGTPFGQEIPSTATPVALAVRKPFSWVTHSFAIDGLHVGSTVEEIEKTCEKRGYGMSLGMNRIACDEGWSVGWAELNGRVDVLLFANEKLLRDIKSRIVSPSQGSVHHRDAK
jgi:hypothetical protein